jgi:hypothetical protein
MAKVKRYLINKKYQQQLLNNAIEKDGVKYVRAIVGNYPEDWIYHPYSGASNFEDWEMGVYLPISPSGKVLYLPIHNESLLPNDAGIPVWYDLVYVDIGGESVWAGDILTPLFQYK